MANERITENLVRDRLRELGFYEKKSGIRVEEQKSGIESVRRALVAASKSGGGGADRLSSSSPTRISLIS